MKKLSKILAALLCSSMLFAGCGDAAQETKAETNESVENTATAVRGEFTASDYCTIKDYKGLVFTKKEIEATEDSIQSEIDETLNSAAELKDLGKDVAAENGNVVNIDYVGYVDGVAFEGGTASGSNLELGSNSFIDGFEAGLVGAKQGEKKTLNLQFPDPYKNNPDLAGKDVVFEVTVNKVQGYQVPEYTDEFVKENTEYQTKAEYEKSIAEEIQKNNLSTALANRLFEIAEFTGEYPKSLQKYYESMYLSSYESMVQSYYGMTLDEYLKQMGTTQESFLEKMGIEESIKSDLILCAVAEQEGIQAKGDDYEAFLEEEAKSRSMDTDALLAQYGEDELEFAYISNEAYQLIYDSIVTE